MEIEEIKRLWREHKEERILDFSDLIRLFDDEKAGGTWFKCPCGASGHLALMRWMSHDRCLSGILNCLILEKQWIVNMPLGLVAGLIKKEEERYLSLLKKAPAIVRKVVAKRGQSEETFHFLRDTHGIDEDTTRAILGHPNFT
jgi:hypothetical protein